MDAETKAAIMYLESPEYLAETKARKHSQGAACRRDLFEIVDDRHNRCYALGDGEDHSRCMLGIPGMPLATSVWNEEAERLWLLAEDQPRHQDRVFDKYNGHTT